jgi:hypothetical protein
MKNKKDSETLEPIDGHDDLSIDQPDEDLTPKFGTEMKIAVLNGPIATTFGNYTYFPIPIESARILINATDFSSYIGHESTAHILSRLLEKPISYSRKELKQKVGQMALVFRLKKRAQEGTILDEDELEKIGYEFGILYRVK